MTPKGGTDPHNVPEHLLLALHSGHHAAEALQAEVQAHNQANEDDGGGGNKSGRSRPKSGKN